MMIGWRWIFGLALLVAGAASARDVPFDQGWRFTRSAGADEIIAPPPAMVNLPHTPRIEPRIVNHQWQGDATYAKRFVAPAAWRGQVVLLRIEAAMNVATVSLNGRRLATHLGGYLPFTIDLTPGLRLGRANHLVIALDNRDNAVTGPKPLKQLDFNTYGGLYRGVRLMVRPPLYLSDEMLADRVAGGGLFVTTPMASADRANVAAAADVANAASSDRSARVSQRLFDGPRLVTSGSATIAVAAGAIARADVRLGVSHPSLWSPQSPHLYRLETRISAAGQFDDVTSTMIGIRSLAMVGGRLAINGRPQWLTGVNRHQEYPYVGYATSPQADQRDARRIKAAGFDYVRLSHYPPSPAFMAAADQLGLVLLDAIPGWQFYNPEPAFRAQALTTCRDMIRRDRNHPSVFAWECSLNETDMPADLMAEFNRVVHDEFPGGWSAGWIDAGYDIYLQSRQSRLQHYLTPTRPYLVSEYGDWEYYAQNAGLAQDQWNDLKPEQRTSRQALGDGEARLLQQVTNIAEAHDDDLGLPAIGDSYWVMFDYNRGYADDLETSGVMSLERLPKLAADFFRSQRDADDGGPMVRIASHWTPQSTPTVRVFSNADEVELRLNGTLVGRHGVVRDRFSKRLAHPPFDFATGGFVAGTLQAIAYRGGREVARNTVVTPGPAAGLCVALDDAGVKPARGDLLFLRGWLLDGAGNPVSTATARVRFAAPRGWTVVGPDTVDSEGGIASVLVRPLADPGNAAGARAFDVAGRLRFAGSCRARLREW